MRPSVAHGVGLGAVLFPPAPGVVRMYFVWEVRPYWAAFGLSHTNCMGFSAIRFVWPNICIFPKVDRGWQNYFDNVTNSELGTYAQLAKPGKEIEEKK